MTRDNGLIVQETWSYAFEEGFEKTTGLKNPHTPSLVYHVLDGATEIWEQEASFTWFKNALLDLNQRDENFLNKSLKEYEGLMEVMESYRQKQVLDLHDLRKLIELMYEAGRLFVIMYYASSDERTPESVRAKALAWRNKDELYDIYERVIKNSITHVFPQAQGKELVVTVQDLDTPPSEELLTQRFNECVFVPGMPIAITTLSGFSSTHEGFSFVEEKATEEEHHGTLKGQIASPGKAQGRARILRRKSQVGDLEDGEILVSPMTTPDFVPAMKRASAIVTDEGGITCHAAIVSRELKKPCVIGTRVATQVIKDGDLVEVDAVLGTVKVLT